MRILAGRFLTGVLGGLFLLMGGGAAAQPVNTGHLVAELVPAAQGIAPGQTLEVALRQQIQPGWHTYWKNAGDSGEPTRIAWTLPPGWTAGEIAWPTPKRIPVGPLMNYGYEGEVLLPMALSAPANARPGQSVTLTAAAAFLVCRELCIPEEATLTLTLPVTTGLARADPRWGPAIARTLAQTPKPAPLTAAFRKEGRVVKLAITGAPLKGADLAQAYFFPYAAAAIEHAAAQPIERGPDGLTLTLAPGYDFQVGAGPASLAGVLSLGDAAYEVTALAGPAPPGAGGLGPPPARTGGAAQGLLAAALLAFLGGVILNLMPCVFPVLAMKAAALAGHAHEAPAARRHGLAFGAGVLAAFLGLAGALLALKAAGAAAGWGFQLQSPAVVAALMLLMLTVALNLSGVFEVGTSLQGAGIGLASRRGRAGAFFTGMLAVVVAAPCTAPFMGPAVGWALTQAPPAALAVFAGLGLGFALPFVMVAFWPGLLRRLPRPGPWMDAFRKALAFPMYGAAAWLVWVLAQQTGAAMLARVLAAAVALALAAWLFGAAQRARLAGRGGNGLGLAAALLAALAVAGAVWPETSGGATAEPYSPERLAAAQAEGHPVLVDYTAAWCVSCQVNEKVALSSGQVAQALKRNGAVYLRADWTKKDPAIAADLARHGRAGVPLYLVYPASGGAPRVLPSILTPGMVARALDEAAEG